ncbi:outer membrane beta-barrel protein [Marinobacteraceae bacterium S3BR75-40.1]
MKKLTSLVFVTTTLSLITLTGHAEERDVRLQLGAGVGVTFVDELCDSTADDPIDCDDTATNYQALAGIRAGDYFGVEGGYVNLGEAESGNDLLKGTAEVDGQKLQAVGYLPFNQHVSLFAKGGMFFWDLEGDAVTGGTSIADFSESGEDPVVSAGIEGALSDNVRLQLAWDRYFNVGNEDRTGESDVDTVGVNAMLLF